MSQTISHLMLSAYAIAYLSNFRCVINLGLDHTHSVHFHLICPRIRCSAYGIRIFTHVCTLNAISNLFSLQNEHLNTHDGFYQIALPWRKLSHTQTQTHTSSAPLGTNSHSMPLAIVSRRRRWAEKSSDFILLCCAVHADTSLSFRRAIHGAHFGIGWKMVSCWLFWL